MPDDGTILQAPMLASGQICLIEHDSQSPLSAAERDALTEANVVLYDRALAALVAEVLPLGGYAEPLSANAGAAPEVSPRALQLAHDGWSVVQLIEARPWCRPHPQPLAIAPPPLQPVARVPVEDRFFTANGLAG